MENYTQYLSTGIITPKGNEFLAMLQQTPEGTMVAIRPLCSALRLNVKGQQEKLADNPKFNCVDIHMVGADGKKREMLCLPVEQVPDWLNSINSKKVAAQSCVFA